MTETSADLSEDAKLTVNGLAALEVRIEDDEEFYYLGGARIA